MPNAIGLYLHYPWCLKKCPYCDFLSLPCGRDEERDRLYLKAIREDFFKTVDEIGLDRSTLRFETMFIGGGTPSLASPAFMEGIFALFGPYLTADAEISMEANPGTVSFEGLARARSLGVNRLSLGMQSFDDGCLKRLGRIHNSADAVAAAEMAQQVGFPLGLNFDLMHGLPGQSAAMALSDLKQAEALGCTHLSWYELTLEEDTYFGRHPPVLPDEEVLAAIEEQGFAFLADHGFERYEVSAFTRGRRCHHNLIYWHFEDYLGFGAGAHSKLYRGGRTLRRAGIEDVAAYLNGDRGSFYAVAAADLPFEFVLNRLRLKEPLDFTEYTARTGRDRLELVPKLLESVKDGLATILPDGRFALSARGKLMLNDVISAFL